MADNRTTIGELYRAARDTLQQAQIPTAALDARLLICHALGLSHEDFIRSPDRELSPDEVSVAGALIARREAREPVARIFGVREFYGREFGIGPQVLDPRPDTETLIDAILDYCRPRGSHPLRILDIGTGSGAILLTLLAELPDATGIGTDISPGALEIARGNAKAHDLDDRANFVRTSWAQGIEGRFDVVVSNPPYVEKDTIPVLSPEVCRFDPHLALDGGEDGLDAFRAIIPQAFELAARPGLIALEVGDEQSQNVVNLLLKRDKTSPVLVEIKRDLASNERCVLAHFG